MVSDAEWAERLGRVEQFRAEQRDRRRAGWSKRQGGQPPTNRGSEWCGRCGMYVTRGHAHAGAR